MTVEVIAFGALAAVIIYSAYRVVTTSMITHAALFLAVTFIGVAGLFLLLDATFLAAAQVLIYAGAVMAVVVFAIMLSDIHEITEVLSARLEAESRPRWQAELRSVHWGWLPAAVAGGLLVLLLAVYATAGWDVRHVARGDLPDQVRLIGLELFSTFVVPFEVASVLLLIAMIGAIVLTRRGGDET